MNLRHFLLMFISALILGNTDNGVETSKDKKIVATKQVMGEIYEALLGILPYSLSLKKFEDPKSKDFLDKNLKTLADKAALLSEHTEFHDATFKFLGNSLAQDAKDMQRLFERGNTRQALYVLDSLTDNCMACHSRLPAHQSQKAANLFKNLDAESFMLDEKARLYLMTRQFDKSLKTYKEVLLSSEYQTAEICLADWIGEYLMIAIRVARDFTDAKDTLVKFQKRNGLPMYAHHDLQVWIKSIDTLSKRRNVKPTLQNIRKIISEAKMQIEFPMDRQGEIYYLFASSLLHEYVLSNPKGLQAAEAYYLLGLTESMVGRVYGASQNEYYLETAIRSAPASTFAEKAYRQLEEWITFENSGSSGAFIPDNSKALLKELRKLISAAQPRTQKH